MKPDIQTLKAPTIGEFENLFNQVFHNCTDEDFEVIQKIHPEFCPEQNEFMLVGKFRRKMSVEIQTISDTEFVVDGIPVTVYQSGDAWLTNPVLEPDQLKHLRNHINALNLKRAKKIG